MEDISDLRKAKLIDEMHRLATMPREDAELALWADSLSEDERAYCGRTQAGKRLLREAAALPLSVLADALEAQEEDETAASSAGDSEGARG